MTAVLASSNEFQNTAGPPGEGGPWQTHVHTVHTKTHRLTHAYIEYVQNEVETQRVSAVNHCVCKRLHCVINVCNHCIMCD